MEHNAQGRRPHFHRGRRGSDRRGSDRRTPQAAEQGPRPSGDQVDVEQIMRDIRARIAQRSGVELSTTQIRELAARRLEAVLDPRSMSPALTEQLRKGAGTPAAVPMPEIEGGYNFQDTTLYESHRGLLRVIRRMLNPILKLFFNPNPLIQALNTQARLNHEAATREAERERRQAEWNALHYEIVNRMITEVSRVSVEMQALAGRIESLGGRVDYADRRVRMLETAPAPAPRHAPQARPEPPAPSAPVSVAEPHTAAAPADGAGSEGGARRKRRRRRGRRSGGGPGVMDPASTGASPLSSPGESDGPDVDDQDDDETEGEMVADVAPPSPEPEPVQAAPAEPVQPAAPPDEPSPTAPVDHPDPGPPDR